MSKRKARGLYKIQPISGRSFFVIARSGKGATTIAREYRSDLAQDMVVTEVYRDPDYEKQAINFKAKG
ncbi:hypothetical protein [Paremcibacter congregatus]|uniref:hypothetical protein n=1 Tax=Paremcibacter congregatus TaxID=2043170 RepID=UPI0030EF7833|tara:strand:+ start:3380 stop:3583 length:204 start_codon:yes stop_codon:yes gene_type:complete